MRTPETMAAAVNAYVEGFSRGDLGAIVNLYAEEATVEDPVGSSLHRGKEAIRAFYAGSLKTGAKLKLDGPIRVGADCAAFAFSVHLNYGGEKRIDVIDIFRFNEAGKVVEMRAFWGPSNMRSLD